MGCIQMAERVVERLGDICSDISYGYTESATSENIGPKFLRITDITSDYIDWNSVPYCKISDEDYNKYKLYYNDIVIARTGATTGYNKQFTKDIDAVYASYLIRFRVDEKKANARYIYYYLKSSAYTGFVNNYVTGAAQPGINATVLSRFKIPLPDLSTQKKIADILSAYDDLIENNLARISLLEKMASELYKEWFVRFRFPGHEAAKFVDGVPEGWEVVQVESVSSLLRRGISPVYNDYGEYTVINQKCIRSSILSLDEARKQERKYPKELNLQDADIVICSTGTGTLGRVGKVFGDLPNTTYDSHVTVVRAAENIGKHYLYHTLKINQTYLMSQGRGSTNQQELSRDTIKKLKIFLPTTEIMQRFEEFIEPIHREIILSEKKLANLTKQRDLLLPRLMSGKLSVEPLLSETA